MGLSGEWFFELASRYGFESMTQNALVIALIALSLGALIGYTVSRLKSQ
jgi:ABC-type spermidine/putrescine transport system permease subunit II